MQGLYAVVLALTFCGCVRHDDPKPAAAPAPQAKSFALDQDDDDNKPLTPAEKYAAECSKAKVPVPPPIGTGDWTESEELAPMQIQTAPDGQKGKVWTYKDKATGGTCIALTRIEGNNKLTGIICVNEKMTSSCVWDFKSDGVKVDIAKGYPPEKFNCLSCHVQNPFIITGVIKGLPRTDQPWEMIDPYTLLPVKPKVVDAPEDCSGAGCHAKSGMAPLDEQSCGSLLLPALGGPSPRMPPGGPNDYSRAILAKCCAMQNASPTGPKAFAEYCVGGKPKIFPEKSGGEPSGDKPK